MSDTTDTTDTTQSSGETIDSASLIVFLLFSGLTVAGLIREFNKKTGVPYTPVLFVLGMFFGKYGKVMGIFGTSITQIENIDPRGILMIFLPVLIFESGFNSDWHYFKKQSPQILILAFPSVLVSAIFLQLGIKIFLHYSNQYYSWSGAFMFGSILSCTDTVAVLALLKEIGAPKKFNSLIEGESLLNDGSCMVLFTIAAEIIKNAAALYWVDIVKLFFTLTVGGAALGIAFGVVASYWMKRAHNDPLLIVNITFITCYLLYYVAEKVDLGYKVSGIVALVSLGLFLSNFGKTKISKEAHHTVQTFWKYIVYAAESTIFLLAGLLVGVKVLNQQQGIQGHDYFKLIGLYLIMNLSRFGGIALFMNWLKKLGYGLTWKDVFVLTYCGLRGAVGISFAMIVAHDDAFPTKLKNLIMFDMAGCAILTLVINAPTVGPFIRAIGLCVTSSVSDRIYLNFLEILKKNVEKYIELQKNNPNFQNVDWNTVVKFSAIEEYDIKIRDLKKEIEQKESEQILKIQYRNAIDQELRKYIQLQRHLLNQSKAQPEEQPEENCQVVNESRDNNTQQKQLNTTLEKKTIGQGAKIELQDQVIVEVQDQKESEHEQTQRISQIMDDSPKIMEELDKPQRKFLYKTSQTIEFKQKQYQPQASAQFESFLQKAQNDIKDQEFKQQESPQQAPNQADTLSDESSNNIEDEELIIECRNRFLFALKEIYWELFDNYQCSASSLLLLVSSVNWDLDNSVEGMSSWEFLHAYFTYPLYTQTLFVLKSLPIIGQFISNMLFNHISNIYDIVSTYIVAHEQVEQMCNDFPLDNKLIDVIQSESKSNRQSAEDYIKNYLNISFPEISRQIQTKKGAYQILEHQKEVINENLQSGQIDDKEYKFLKSQIDSRIIELDNFVPNWQSTPIKELLKRIKLFSVMPENVIDVLISQMEEVIFEKDSYIFKKGDRVHYIYVITRGSCTEQSSSSAYAYNQKHGVDSIVPMFSLTDTSLNYRLSCIADAVVYAFAFKVINLQKVVRKIPQIEEFIWKQNIYLISRLYYETMQPITYLNEREIKNDLLDKLKFRKYKKGQKVNLADGGILLQGQLAFDQSGQAIQGEKTECQQQAQETIQKLTRQNTRVDAGKFTGPQAILLSSKNENAICISDKCKVLHITDPSIYKQLVKQREQLQSSHYDEGYKERPVERFSILARQSKREDYFLPKQSLLGKQILENISSKGTYSELKRSQTKFKF